MNYLQIGKVNLNSIVDYKQCVVGLILVIAIIIVLCIWTRYIKYGFHVSAIVLILLVVCFAKVLYGVISYPQNIKFSSNE